MISPLSAKLDRKWIEASVEITELREQLAAVAQGRNVALSLAVVNKKEAEKQHDLLVVSQAYAAQLRETLGNIADARFWPWQVDKAEQALALPQDNTALCQWGAKLLREMASEFRKGDPVPKHWAVIALERKADELEGKK